MSRVLNNAAEISLANFLNKINCQEFSKIIVVDRENCGTFEKPASIEMSTVWIEVVNKKNKNLAKGQFIAADSTKRDAADIIMSILIYEIAKTFQSRIILVTKDHFGTTLKDLINNIFKNKIEVFDPKDLKEYYNWMQRGPDRDWCDYWNIMCGPFFMKWQVMLSF